MANITEAAEQAIVDGIERMAKACDAEKVSAAACADYARAANQLAEARAWMYNRIHSAGGR